ncbi:MAG: substrate-binding domain-containing protein [Kiritimatiellae bacterium]|nr:substrate-binding domain-containing protein [Kiritimatiellia bacterium]
MAESTTLSAKTLTRRNAKDKTVLAILPMGNGMAQAALSGIRAEAAVRRWHVMSAETERASDGSLRVERSSGSIASVGELAALMRPDGVIVWGYALSPDEVAANVGTVPSVFIDPPFDIRPSRRKFAVVRGDARAVASLAARELLFRDFADLAFVPSNEDESWNHERGEAFRDCARVAGARYHEFHARRGEALGCWLAALPKPCGLFAANDKAGDEVLGACAALGIAVPQDISVVGVDNMVYLCEGTAPTLSSIMMDHVGEGRAAAELLADWMDAPRRSPPEPRFVPPLRVVRRASSRAMPDRRVAKAIEFIRLGACEEGFSPRDVVANMGVSRSLAFDLFRRVAGHTILDEIQSVRLERAQELLRQGRRPDIVGADCGFSSHDDFRRVFRKRCGMSVKAWKAMVK